jgi:hypothetical protein
MELDAARYPNKLLASDSGGGADSCPAIATSSRNIKPPRQQRLLGASQSLQAYLPACFKASSPMYGIMKRSLL